MQSVPITNSVSSNSGQAMCTRYNIMSTNKTERHDIAEILLKVALNTTTPKPLSHQYLLKYKILRKWITHKKLIQHREQAYQQTGNGDCSDSVVLPTDG